MSYLKIYSRADVTSAVTNSSQLVSSLKLITLSNPDGFVITVKTVVTFTVVNDCLLYTSDAADE